MSLFDIRLVDPRTPNEYSVYVDGWSGLTFSSDRKAPGACAFRIARDAEHRELMETYQLFALLQDGVEADNCRYLIRSVDGNDLPTDDDPVPMVSYTCATIWDALRDVDVVHPGTEETLDYPNTTVGQIIWSVLNQAAAQGLFAWWGYDGLTFTASTDSAGKPWQPIEAVQFDDGVTIFEMLDWFIQQHYLEVSTSGGRINAYVPDTRGLDLTKATNPVKLAEGYNLFDAPWQRTYDDIATAVTVVGGETKDPADPDLTRPRLKVKVYAAGTPTASQNFSLKTLHGNMYGGRGRHDKERILKGKDWDARIPGQIDLILQSGASLALMVELHAPPQKDTPEGPHRYFLSRLKERDPDWELVESFHGNQALYRPSVLSPLGMTQWTIPGDRGLTRFTWVHPESKFQFESWLSHYRAHAGKKEEQWRRDEAKFTVKKLKASKLPHFFAADINDSTHKRGRARDILEASGLVPIRETNPNAAYATWDSNGSSKTNKQWIDDIWVAPGMKTHGGGGILTVARDMEISDHTLWMQQTIDFVAGVPIEQSHFGIRERRIEVKGVQSITDLANIGKAWLALRAEPRTARTYKTTVVETPRPPLTRQPGAASRPPAEFKLWQTITRNAKPGGFAQGSRYSFLATPTLNGQNVVVTRFNGKTESYYVTVPTRSMDELRIETIAKDPKNSNVDTDWLFLPIGSTTLASTGTRTWARLPFKAGRSWTVAETVPYVPYITPQTDQSARGAQIQGETGPMQDYYWRLYGNAVTSAGSIGTPVVPWRVDVVRHGVLVETIDLSGLARVNGAPIGGRIEPLGISRTLIGGWPHLLIAVVSGPETGPWQVLIYSYPILVDELGTVWVDRGREQLVPIVDYGPADTIFVDLANGLPSEPERIVVVSGSCDDDTSGTYIVTTGDWLDDRDAAVDRLLAKYSKDD